jgi:hypothetical protein
VTNKNLDELQTPAEVPSLVEVRCRSEYDVNRTTTKIIAGPYSLALLPKVSGGLTEGVLSFEDFKLSIPGYYRNPEEEGRLILDILSVLLGTTWNVTGLRVDGVDIQGIRTRVLDLKVVEQLAEDIDLTKEMTDVLRLDKEALLQFIRASHTFNLGVQAGAVDFALSFLLLVTSVECLSSLESFIPSSQLNRNKKSTERYVRFIKQFCIDLQQFYGDDGEDGFTRNLKTIYYRHRSAFIHSGKEVPIAASMIADEHELPSVMHHVGGETINTPGLVWFARVVQRSLVGFLRKFRKNVEADRSPIREIAAKRYVITVQA